MRPFTSDELDRMQSTQEGAMQGTCNILVYSSMTDDYGNPKAVYTAGGDVECGLEHVQPKEAQDTGEVPMIDARLRLPIDTEIDERDRIQVTHRFGEELDSPQVFEIAGPVKRGPSGLVLLLKVVDDGTEG